MISLILLAASLVALVRSYRAADSSVFFWLQSDHPGGHYGHTVAGYSLGRFIVHSEIVRDLSPAGFRRRAANFGQTAVTDPGTFNLQLNRSTVSGLYYTNLKPKSVTQISFGGIEVKVAHQIPMLEDLALAEHPSVTIPIGYVAGILAVMPFLASRSLRWQRILRHRNSNNLCTCCGYDMRFTPDICPECGRKVDSARASAGWRPSWRLVASGCIAVLVLAGTTLVLVRGLPRIEKRLLDRLHREEELAKRLHDAAIASDIAGVKALLNRGADPSEDGVLHEVVRRGDSPMARLLLDEGAATDGIDCKSVMSDRAHTPLADAVISGHTELVPLLLERGANWKKVSYEDAAALLLWDPQFLLIKQAKSPNDRDEAGNTLLHLAVGRGDALAVEDLLKRGANPNLENESNLTPLQVVLTRPADRHRDYDAPPFPDANFARCLSLILSRGSTFDEKTCP